ncbi:MAG: glycosyltransferase family 39 protein [Herminiimonas sp.]|nr:glycosyltransferase family 39 protein [Herminiimonas sp.]
MSGKLEQIRMQQKDGRGAARDAKREAPSANNSLPSLAAREPLAPGLTPVVVLILVVVFLLLWFYALDARTLVPTDEGRYAEMAREMVASGDWITPRLNGIKYFEKPPLQNWANALTFELFGLGEWQARLWTGLCGLLGIGLVYYAGRKVFDARTGWTAALVLASSFFWAALGHVNTLDMGLSGMMTITLAGLLLAQRPDAASAARRNWMLVCWAGMALAVLSKGLIGIVLPGAVLVLYTVWSRDWALWKRLHLVAGAAVFLLITAPWFVAVSMRNPEFAHFFFIHEHLQRFTSKVHNRAGPWYYFIPILALGMAPWLGVLVQSLWRAAAKPASIGLVVGGNNSDPLRTDLRNADLRNADLRQADLGKTDLRHAGQGHVDLHNTFQPDRLLLVWAAFIFFFFSISGSKLPSYILPIFPALALLIARSLQLSSRRAIEICAWLTALFGVLGLALASRMPLLAKDDYSAPLYQAYVPWVLAASALALVASLVSLWLARRQRDWSILALAVGGFVAGQLLMLGHEPLGRFAAGTLHVPAIQAEMGSRRGPQAGPGPASQPTSQAGVPETQTPIYAVGRYEQSLPFYLRHTFILVEHADEMEFGLEQQPELWIPKRAEFVKKWTADHDAGRKDIAIMSPDDYAALLAAKVPMRVIGQDPRRVIVTNAVGVAAAPAQSESKTR